VYKRFLDKDARKAFFEEYKDIENLWEILSPAAALRDYILPFKRLAQLYAAVRNAYAEKPAFVADLAYKTKRLVEEGASHEGLGNITKTVTFDVKTIESLRKEKGTDEGKVFNLVRGLQREIDDDSNIAAVLLPLKERAERLIKDLEDRKTTGLAAMDLLSAIAIEKENTKASAADSGLSAKAFAVLWMLRDDAALEALA
jgi:type I restriction enzyme R subunit